MTTNTVNMITKPAKTASRGMRLRLGASLASEELLLLRECCLRTDRLLLPELHLRGGSGLDLAPSSRSDGPVRVPLDMEPDGARAGFSGRGGGFTHE